MYTPQTTVALVRNVRDLIGICLDTIRIYHYCTRHCALRLENNALVLHTPGPALFPRNAVTHAILHV